MGTIRALSLGASKVRPLVNVLRSVDRTTSEVGVRVIDGPTRETALLRAALGVDAAHRPDDDGPLLMVAVADHDATPGATELARAKRDGRRALAIVAGAHVDRELLERAIVAHPPLELSNIVHVVDLADAEVVRQTLANVLGPDGIAVARRYPSMRPSVADTTIAQASRQASSVGAAIIVPGADLPVITMIQVRLVAQLAAVYGRPLDLRRSLEIAGVLAGALGWRAVARRAVASVPIAGFALRAGIAYSGTRAVGEACKAYFATLGDRADVPLDGLANALNGALKKRKGT